MSIPGKITISKVSTSAGEDYIKITLNDENAGITFLEGRLSLANFADAITGLGRAPFCFEVMGLQNVGKQIQTRKIVVELPPDLAIKDRKEMAFKLAKKKAGRGWEVHNYFNSQNSFFTDDEGRYCARTTASRWVLKKEE